VTHATEPNLWITQLAITESYVQGMTIRYLALVPLLTVVAVGCSSEADVHTGAAKQQARAAAPSFNASAPFGLGLEYAYTPLCDGVCHTAAAQKVSDQTGCTGTAVPAWVGSRRIGSNSFFTVYGPPKCWTPVA
jgi:hypothetical protein